MIVKNKSNFFSFGLSCNKNWRGELRWWFHCPVYLKKKSPYKFANRRTCSTTQNGQHWGFGRFFYFTCFWFFFKLQDTSEPFKILFSVISISLSRWILATLFICQERWKIFVQKQLNKCAYIFRCESERRKTRCINREVEKIRVVRRAHGPLKRAARPPGPAARLWNDGRTPRKEM